MAGRAQGEAGRGEGTGAATPARARVVFADDSSSIRRLAERMLGADYALEICADGDEAVAAARREPPDVVVSDLLMPRVDGREVMRQLRADPATRHVPFILVTAEEDQAIDTMVAGADDYLTKPFTAAALRARVAAAVRTYHVYRQLELQHEELRRVHAESARLELELREAHKLEAVGRLASGIAHEFNTPVQFLADQTRYLRDAMQGLERVMAAKDEALAASAGPEVRARLAALEEELDVPYLRAGQARVFERMLDGLQRVGGLVKSLKEFANPDQQIMQLTDLNRALLATLEVARSEYQPVADVVTDLGPVPQVICHAGSVNQVFLGILVNAAQAVGDVQARTGRRGTIRVATALDGPAVRVSIGDTGAGIPEAARHRIFEPFYTTREVSLGRGLGLASARAVVERHRGRIRFESEVGMGTIFHVWIPIGAGAAPADLP